MFIISIIYLYGRLYVFIYLYNYAYVGSYRTLQITQGGKLLVADRPRPIMPA